MRQPAGGLGGKTISGCGDEVYLNLGQSQCTLPTFDVPPHVKKKTDHTTRE